MMKWLLIALVVGLALWWMTRGRKDDTRAGSRPGQSNPSHSFDGRPSPPKPSSAAAEPQPMVRCAHCGLMLPRQEALPGPDDQHFCGPEHLRLGRPPREGSGS